MVDPIVLIGGLLAAGWAIKKLGDLSQSVSSESSDGDAGSAGLSPDNATAISSSDGSCGGHGHGGDCGGHGGGHGGW